MAHLLHVWLFKDNFSPKNYFSARYYKICSGQTRDKMPQSAWGEAADHPNCFWTTFIVHQSLDDPKSASNND